MKKLLSSDFYRLFRTKTFYICTAASSAMMLILLLIAKFTDKFLSGVAEKGDHEYTSAFAGESGLSFGIGAFNSNISHLYITIIIGVFVASEFGHGTIKNVVSKGFNKVKIYFSKLIAMTVATYLLVLVMFVITTIAATIMMGNFGDITGEYIGQLLRMIGIEMILYIALISLFLMVAMMVRNSGAAIAICIGLTTVNQILYPLLEIISKNKIHFTEFGLVNNITNAGLNMSMEHIIRSIIVGVAFFAVTTWLGITLFKKSDIK